MRNARLAYAETKLLTTALYVLYMFYSSEPNAPAALIQVSEEPSFRPSGVRSPTGGDRCR